MRKLQARDLFTFSKMITKMELKDKFKELLSPDKKDTQKAHNLGIDVIMMIIENVSLAEDEFYAFVAPIAEVSIEEAKEMPFRDLKELFKGVVEDADFASFFN